MRSTKSPSWTRRLLGFDSLPAPPHVFSLSRRSLSYARLERAAYGFSVADLRSVELPTETFVAGAMGGALRQPETFALHLAALLDEEPRPTLADASLLVSDSWLRVAFTEIGDLPSGNGRAEVLRWKLKRLVPFRVEELRVEGYEVAALPGQEEPRRMLLAFGVEQLLAQLEEQFAARQIRIGYLSNRSLTLLSALADRFAERPLAALVVAEADGYAAAFARRGEPVLYRYKRLEDPGLDIATARRDLALTRAFLEENLPGQELKSTLLLAEPTLETQWRALLEEGLGVPVEPVDGTVLPISSTASVSWTLLAPMIGAVAQEVS